MLKTLGKACSMVIVPHWEVRLVFAFSDANSALNAPAITQAGGMLSILLFSAIPCGNQDLLAASGVVFIEVGA